MWTFREEYDLIASLGGNCAAASQIRYRGLRAYALGFDWLLMNDVRPVDYLAEAFRTDFGAMCRRENLSVCDNPYRHQGVWEYRYKDAATGFRYLHLFHQPLETPGEFEHGREVMMRRIERFSRMVAQSKNVLLVLETGFVFDVAHAKNLHAALAEKFPGVTIELRVMQFGAERESTEVIPGIGQLVRHARNLDLEYDMNLTAPEWDFLDFVKLSDRFPRPAAKPKGFLRFLYTLWKKWGKQLEMKGYGCVNMTLKGLVMPEMVDTTRPTP